MPADDDIPYINRTSLRWDTNHLLGEGSFGIVYGGQYNGTPVAIKVVKRPSHTATRTDDQRHQEFAALKQHRREIHRFKVVQNPYIIQYLGVFRDVDPRDLYIVTEFLEGGSLHDSLLKMRARRAVLDGRSFLQVALHIAYGLNHVHSERYTHGDMKPQNVLLTSALEFINNDNGWVAFFAKSAKVKIADFGLSKRLEGANKVGVHATATTDGEGMGSATNDFGHGPCGTFLYMSPEAYNGVHSLTDSQAKAADVYAYGLILFELLSSLQSWQIEGVNNPMQLCNLVMSGKRPAWGPQKTHVDHRYVQLVETCWSPNCDDRPTVDQIIDTLHGLQQEYDRSLSAKDDGTNATGKAASPTTVRRTKQHHPAKPSGAQKHQNGPNPTQPPPPAAAQPPPQQQQDQHSRPQQKQDKVPSPPPLALPQATPAPSQRPVSPPRAPTPPMLMLPTMGAQPKGVPEATEQEYVPPTSVVDPEATSNVGAQPTSRAPPAGYLLYEIGPAPAPTVMEYGDYTDTFDALPSNAYRSEGRTTDVSISESDIGNPTVRKVNSRHLTESEMENVFSNGAPKQSVNATGDLNGDALGNGAGAAHRGHAGYVQNGANDVGENARANTACSDLTDIPGALPVKSVDVQPRAVEENHGDESTVVPQIDETKNEKDENLDWSEVDGLPVRKVESGLPINPAGQRLAIPESGEERPHLGMGSIVNEGDRQKRSDSVALQSFWNAAEKGGGHEDRVAKPPEKIGVPMRDFPILEMPTPEEALAHKQREAAKFGQPGGNVPGPGAGAGPDRVYSENNGYGNGGGDGQPWKANGVHSGQAGQQTNGYSDARYSHPAGDGDGSDGVAQFFNADNKITAGGYNGAVGGKNGMAGPGMVGQPQNMTGGVAPSGGGNVGMKSQGMQQGTHGMYSGAPKRMSPGWGVTPNHGMDKFGGHTASMSMIGDADAVMRAVQRPDRVTLVWDLWRKGNWRDMACGLAKCSKLDGEDMLDLCCRLLQENNEGTAGRADTMVAKELCTTIGNIGRNSEQRIGRDAMSRGLHAMLGTMHHHNNDISVYVACNYALSNLLKVDNVIGDAQLRSHIATWIVFMLSWNIRQEGGNRTGAHWDMLGYTATCAARNFMWMNEANVTAFLTVMHLPHGETSSTSTLMAVLQYYSEWARQMTVVESTVSAMAMLVQYPLHRAEFVQRDGLKCVTHMLGRYGGNVRMSMVTFSMVAAMFSGPTFTSIEVQSVEAAFVSGHCAWDMVQGLQIVRQQAAAVQAGGGRRRREDEAMMVEALAGGLTAVCNGLQYSTSVMGSFAEAGLTHVLIDLLREVVAAGQAVASGGGVREGDGVVKAIAVVDVQVRRRLAVVVVHAVMALCRDRAVKRAMSEASAGVAQSLQALAELDACCEHVVRCALAALTSF